VAAYALTQIQKQMGHELFGLVEQKLGEMFKSNDQQE